MTGLWQTISVQADRYPDAPALSRPGRRETLAYHDLVSRVERLSRHIQGLDGGAMGLLADNGFDWILTDLASLEAGRCLVPIPTFFTASQREHALDDADARYLVAPASCVLPDSYTRMGQLPGLDELVLWWRQPASETGRVPDRTVKVTYTSGSTGNPKGVCLDAALIAEVAETIAEATIGCRIERHLCILPLATLLENIAGVYAPLLRGAEIVVPGLAELGFQGSSKFAVELFLAGISNARPHSMILIPQLLDALVQATHNGWQPPDSLKFIAVGGGRVSKGLLDNATAAGLPVYQGYGLSECGSVVSLNLPGQNRPGSVGKPLPHVEVSVVDGEIRVSKKLFLGYTNDAAVSSHGQLDTGDLGYLDADGFLYINGRKKNLIITSFGRNISPEWVESELTAIPGVVQAVVVGEARPYLGALVYAVPAIDTASLDAAIKRANSSLPDYAQVGRWTRLSQPLSVQDGTLTSNGRPRRDVISSRFAEQIDSLYLTENPGNSAAPAPEDQSVFSE